MARPRRRRRGDSRLSNTPTAWLVNGVFARAGRARIDPNDRGLRFGDGVYETLLVHRRYPHQLDAHLARMQDGLALVGIELDARAAFPMASILELAGRGLGRTGSGQLRLTVTRGVGDRPTTLASVTPLAPTSGPEPGARLRRVQTPLRRPAQWSRLKSLSQLPYVLAARQAGLAHEALLVDRDRVLEATTANIIGVRRGCLMTPPPDAGILAGVTCETVLALADTLGIAWRRAPLTVAQLLECEEVCLTSSVRGVRWVQSLDEHQWPAPAADSIATQLVTAYTQQVIAQCQSQAL